MICLRRKNTKQIKQIERTNQKDVWVIKPPEELINKDYFKELEQHIEKISDYHTALASNVARFLQILPYPPQGQYCEIGGLLKLALDRSILALRYRKAYLLPKGADTETVHNEEEFWTYGVFAAALLRDLWHVPICFQINIKKGNNFDTQWNPLFDGVLPVDREFKFSIKDEYIYCPEVNLFLIKSLFDKSILLRFLQNERLFREFSSTLIGKGTGEGIAKIVYMAEQELIGKAKTENPMFFKQVAEGNNEEKSKNLANGFIKWLNKKLESEKADLKLNSKYIFSNNFKYKNNIFISKHLLEKYQEQSEVNAAELWEALDNSNKIEQKKYITVIDGQNIPLIRIRDIDCSAEEVNAVEVIEVAK